MKTKTFALPVLIFIIFASLIVNFYSGFLRFSFELLNYIFFYIVLAFPVVLFGYEFAKNENKFRQIFYGFLSGVSLLLGLCGFLFIVGSAFEGSPIIVSQVDFPNYIVVANRSGGCGAASCSEIINIIQQKNIVPGLVMTKKLDTLEFSDPVTLIKLGSNKVEVKNERNSEKRFFDLKENLYF
jgi:hypothetical protein